MELGKRIEAVIHHHESGKEGHKTEPHSGKTPIHDDHIVLSETAMSPGQITVSRFQIDGIVKSLNNPVSGADLYRIAGNPKSVSMGGKYVTNDAEPVEVPDDIELTIAR